jgi:hypothetical protein
LAVILKAACLVDKLMKLTDFILFTGCLSLLTLFANCQNYRSKNVSSADYFLTGDIKGFDTGWIYVKHRQTGKIDSAIIKNGRFTVIGQAETPEFCNIGSGSRGKRDFYFGFFLAACKMTIIANKDSLFDAAIDIQGYFVQDEFKQFQKQMRPIDVLSNENRATEKTPLNKDSLDLKQKELDKKRKEIIWSYAAQTPNSYITAFEASSYFTEKEDLQKLETIFNRMNPALKKWHYSQRIKMRLQENNINVEE